jgi:hypothetical protein
VVGEVRRTASLSSEMVDWGLTVDLLAAAGTDQVVDAVFQLTKRMREYDAERTDEAAAKLFGLEELYDLYKAKQAADQLAAIAPSRRSGPCH